MKAILLAMAAALTAAANTLDDNPETDAAPSSPPNDAPKRRGRPPGTAAAAGEPAPAEPAPAAPATGKTYEQLQALIRPLVEEGRGEEVKKVIAKYSAGGLKELQSKDHAAFEKDISALQY